MLLFTVETRGWTAKPDQVWLVSLFRGLFPCPIKKLWALWRVPSMVQKLSRLSVSEWWMEGGRKEQIQWDPTRRQGQGHGTWGSTIQAATPSPLHRTPPGQPLPTRSTLAPKVTLRGQHPCRCCREGLPSSVTCMRAHMSPVSWTQSPQDRTPGAFWWPMDHCDPVLRTRLWKASGQRRHSSLEQPSRNQPQLTLGETGYSEAKPHQTSEGSPEWSTSRSLPGSWPPVPLLPQHRRRSDHSGFSLNLLVWVCTPCIQSSQR